jgi:hypothetical protein
MKLVKMLDQEGTALVSDPINLSILTKLVTNELSITDLSTELNQPHLKIWRKMQKLLKANLVELTQTKKVGNIEKKITRQPPPPSRLTIPLPKTQRPYSAKAYEIYSDIQKEW